MAYRCLHCKEGFEDEKSLRNHKFAAMEMENPSVEHLFCTDCEKDYHGKRAYTLHKRQVRVLYRDRTSKALIAHNDLVPPSAAGLELPWMRQHIRSRGWSHRPY